MNLKDGLNGNSLQESDQSSSGTKETDGKFGIYMQFSLYVFDPPCSPDTSQVDK